MTTTKVMVQSLADYTHAQLLTAEGKSLIADEPAEDGGDDLGPTPLQMLAWALGACTAMTVQLYARRKKYPLDEVAVEVDHEKGADRDTMHRRIVVRGALSEAQRDDLLRVAQKCPVHRAISRQPDIIDSIEVV